MANQIIQVGVEVTVPNTEDTIIIKRDVNKAIRDPLCKVVCKCLAANTGTIKFSVNDSAAGASHAYAAGETFIGYVSETDKLKIIGSQNNIDKFILTVED